MTNALPAPRWVCPVCRGTRGVTRFRAPARGSEGAVDPHAFRPSSTAVGRTAASVVRCLTCSHSSLEATLDPARVAAAYAETVDLVSLEEEAGQVLTASRDLAVIESVVSPGRLLDVGCWTGSFLVAARGRGWGVKGVEPSRWAAGRASERGVEVVNGDIWSYEVEGAPFDAIVMCDVLEHLAQPAEAVARVSRWLRPGGAVWITVPDGGSRLARALGRRWWSVLPMHLQYFTRSSMRRMLEGHGLSVVEMTTHPKVFSAAYYASRLTAYSTLAARAVTAVLNRSSLSRRLVAPDLRDRMAVLATSQHEAELGSVSHGGLEGQAARLEGGEEV